MPTITDTAVPRPATLRQQALEDFRIAARSRAASLLGRKEVLTGKAKFGIFGDGKEVAQVALARAMRPGDVRSGYYRDQTVVFALGLGDVQQFFAQLYADPDGDPFSRGRQMNAHFGCCMLDEVGNWLPQTERPWSSSDLSPTGSQMPRAVGLAQASKMYRGLPDLSDRTQFSHGGNEICWVTIGNASCAEGLFWESVNAACVLQVPLVVSVWDDEYGISVPNRYQVAKSDVGALLSGFKRTKKASAGLELFTVKGWDYPALLETYAAAADIARRDHVPVAIHVVELTQPQGHSTSGSHERYKSPERLEWERDHDGLARMRAWLIDSGIADEATLAAIEAEEREGVEAARKAAWSAARAPIELWRSELEAHLNAVGSAAGAASTEAAVAALARVPTPLRRDLVATAREVLVSTLDHPSPARDGLAAWVREHEASLRASFGRHLVADGDDAADRVPAVAPTYAEDAPSLNGFEIVNRNFDAILARFPEVVAMGEDVGKLGDVNQGFSGLQEKYGELRVSDTGIREATILGQAIGMAMRGMRPIAEIQYLDYLLYALQLMSDDLATVRWRTGGGQKAPVIVRTRGHRLEGVWHSGSPMAGILNLVRGVHVCVPRDMTRAAGFYNTLLEAGDPGLVVEVLNGYRLKERLPSNLADMRLPLGVVEVLRAGSDITAVTYGATCRVVLEAADTLARLGIEAEVIDVQTLLPFDRSGAIGESLRKTGRLLIVDEDVPGGASAFILQQVIERQQAFAWLDAAPVTLTGSEHRPPYGSDGDWVSKPSRETVVEAAYELVREGDRRRPALFP